MNQDDAEKSTDQILDDVVRNMRAKYTGSTMQPDYVHSNTSSVMDPLTYFVGQIACGVATSKVIIEGHGDIEIVCTNIINIARTLVYKLHEAREEIEEVVQSEIDKVKKELTQ